MMDRNAIPDGFEQVWARVTETSQLQEVPLAPVQELEHFLNGELRSIAFYRVLAGQFQGRERQVIFQILADERRHLKELQLEYFMRTGDSFLPEVLIPPETGAVLTALREAFLTENETARDYAGASSGRGGELGALYSAIAADEAMHARRLREIVGRCFTEQA